MQVAVTRRAEVVNDKDAADLKHHLQLVETIQSSVVKRLSGGCEGLTMVARTICRDQRFDQPIMNGAENFNARSCCSIRHRWCRRHCRRCLWLEQSLRLPQGALQYHGHDGLPDEFDGLQRQQSRARGLVEIGAEKMQRSPWLLLSCRAASMPLL
jgi:hypothetical protein